MRSPGNLTTDRKQSNVAKIIAEEQDNATWINQEYAEQDVDIGTRNLANRKSHGDDGIPGEEYKATRKLEIGPITKIANQIKTGQSIHENWTSGKVAYI